MDIFRPVMESAMILAAKYVDACGRDCVLAQDIHMGLMYAARNVTGKHLGTLFPEEGDADSDSDSGSWETVEEGELEWTRYEGTEDDMALKMNECADTWDSWEPETPAEWALKNAVDTVRARGQAGVF